MAALPGHVGLPVVGDKSVEFYRDPVAFVTSRIEKFGSRIFVSRFLNKPTVFVTSNQGVLELLNDADSCTEMGYRQFMEGIYGTNVVFTDGEDAQQLRSALQKLLLSSDSHQQFTKIVDRLSDATIEAIDTREPVAVYSVFKKLATEVCLSLFLDIDFEQSAALAERIVALTTTHWHGIVSLQYNLRLPGLSQRSAFGHALRAKEALLEIIEEKLSKASKSDGFPQRVAKMDFKHDSPTMTKNHILLFTSALVPKAIASLLTSFVVQLANRKSALAAALADPLMLECVLLEVQRLWPPFIGGRRIATQDFSLCGLRVPRGHALVFMTHPAHRDPALFADPDSFIPARWRGRNKEDRNKLFLFGSGPRCCIGQHMVWHILTTVCGRLAGRLSWDIVAAQSLAYKWLPVSRPKHDLQLLFSRRPQQQGEEGQDREKEEDEIQEEDEERAEEGKA